jgi:hypothetical protein
MQSYRQVVGRMVRQGNKHRCLIYNFYAKDTVDVIVRQIAEGKELISKAFMTGPSELEAAQKVLQGRDRVNVLSSLTNFNRSFNHIRGGSKGFRERGRD